MEIFKPVSLKSKLVLMMVSAILLSVLFYGGIFAYRDVKELERNIIRNLEVLARAISSTNRAALVFKDKEAGDRILSALNEESQIDVAAVFDDEGQLFVSYFRDNQLSYILDRKILFEEGVRRGKDRIEIVKNIVFENEIIGRFYIRANTKELDTQIENHLILVFSMFCLTLSLAILFSIFLQRFISRPILSLAGTAKNISDKNDYSIRAQYEGSDELGILYSGFNDMLKQIQIRDKKLEEYNLRLEDEVGARTAELQKAQKELLNKEKLAIMGTLASMVSHEIRNPLGTMRNSAYTIKRLIEDGDYNVDDELKRIERNVVRCDNIIEELLDFVRPFGEKFQEIAIDPWLKETIEEQPHPPQMEITLDFESRAILRIDPESLRRAVLNVMTNAFQSMEEMRKNEKDGEGEKKSQFRVRTFRNSDSVHIEFQDNGVGIASESVQQIFEPLYSTKSFGVGLGLPVVKGVMDYHQGKIEVVSQEKKGATIILKFPFIRGNGNDRN